MATNTTYTTLFSDVQVYLERGGSQITDPTVYNQIPRLINAAERDLMLFLKLQGEIEVLVDPTGLSAGNPVIQKPDRWRETVSMTYGTGAGNNTHTPLFPRSLEYCLYYWPDLSETDVANPPLFYADYNLQNWLISPTPAATFPLKAICYMQPQYLDSGNQSNFFSTYTPNALLFATLLQAAPFLKGDTRIPVWQGLLNQQLASLSGTDLQKILDRAAQRNMV